MSNAASKSQTTEMEKKKRFRSRRSVSRSEDRTARQRDVEAILLRRDATLPRCTCSETRIGECRFAVLETPECILVFPNRRPYRPERWLEDESAASR